MDIQATSYTRAECLQARELLNGKAAPDRWWRSLKALERGSPAGAKPKQLGPRPGLENDLHLGASSPRQGRSHPAKAGAKQKSICGKRYRPGCSLHASVHFGLGILAPFPELQSQSCSLP